VEFGSPRNIAVPRWEAYLQITEMSSKISSSTAYFDDFETNNLKKEKHVLK